MDTITIINTVKVSYFLEWSRSGIFSRSYLWRGALEWSGKIFWEGRDKRSLLLKKWSISKSGLNLAELKLNLNREGLWALAK